MSAAFVSAGASQVQPEEICEPIDQAAALRLAAGAIRAERCSTPEGKLVFERIYTRAVADGPSCRDQVIWLQHKPGPSRFVERRMTLRAGPCPEALSAQAIAVQGLGAEEFVLTLAAVERYRAGHAEVFASRHCASGERQPASIRAISGLAANRGTTGAAYHVELWSACINALHGVLIVERPGQRDELVRFDGSTAP